MPREPGALAISHSSPTPSSPPRAGTIDRPDRLDLDLWLWPLGGWTALRGLPWPHPTGPEKTLDWLRASLSRRGSEGLLGESAPLEGTVMAGPAPSFPFV